MAQQTYTRPSHLPTQDSLATKDVELGRHINDLPYLYPKITSRDQAEGKSKALILPSSRILLDCTHHHTEVLTSQPMGSFLVYAGGNSGQTLAVVQSHTCIEHIAVGRQDNDAGGHVTLGGKVYGDHTESLSEVTNPPPPLPFPALPDPYHHECC